MCSECEVGQRAVSGGTDIRYCGWVTELNEDVILTLWKHPTA